MAGPNLTGWTATSLTPVATRLNGGAPAGMMRFTPQEGVKNNLASVEAIAKQAVTKAQATGNAEDWQDAFARTVEAETVRDHQAQAGKPAAEQAFIESYGARRQRVAKEFETKYPGAEPDVAALEERLATTVATSEKRRASLSSFSGPQAPATSPGGWWADDPARIAGLSAAGQPSAINPNQGAPIPDGVQSDVIGGAGPTFNPGQVAGGAGGPSLSGPSSGWTPTAAFSPATIPQAPSSSNSASPTDQYNLTPSEFGSNVPNPRAAVAQGTPLEQLLRTIYPDAPTTGADPLADARNPGAAPSAFNDVIAYLTQQSAGGGSGSGYVQAPQMTSGGGAIASTIPGAPTWLGGQINNLPTGGGGGTFVQAAPSGGGANTLLGLAAISAEQRVQQAQLAAEQKRRDDAYFAQQAAEVEARRRAAQFTSLQSGFVSPIPAVPSGWNNSPMIVNGIQVGQRPY